MEAAVELGISARGWGLEDRRGEEVVEGVVCAALQVLVDGWPEGMVWAGLPDFDNRSWGAEQAPQRLELRSLLLAQRDEHFQDVVLETGVVWVAKRLMPSIVSTFRAPERIPTNDEFFAALERCMCFVLHENSDKASSAREQLKQLATKALEEDLEEGDRDGLYELCRDVSQLVREHCQVREL